MKPTITIALYRLYPLEFLRGAKTSPAGAGGGLIGRTVVMVVKLDESGKHWKTCKRLKIWWSDMKCIENTAIIVPKLCKMLCYLVNSYGIVWSESTGVKRQQQICKVQTAQAQSQWLPWAQHSLFAFDVFHQRSRCRCDPNFVELSELAFGFGLHRVLVKISTGCLEICSWKAWGGRAHPRLLLHTDPSLC